MVSLFGRFRELPGVGTIPFGCERDRLISGETCSFHLDFVAIRTPRASDDDAGERVIKDYARADGVFSLRERHRKSKKEPSETMKSLHEAACATAAELTAAAGTAEEAFEPNDPVLPSTASASDEQDTSVGRRSRALEKLTAARSFRDRVAALRCNSQILAGAQGQEPDDRERFVGAYGTILDPDDYLEEGDDKAWHGVGEEAFLLKAIEGKKHIEVAGDCAFRKQI